MYPHLPFTRTAASPSEKLRADSNLGRMAKFPRLLRYPYFPLRLMRAYPFR